MYKRKWRATMLRNRRLRRELRELQASRAAATDGPGRRVGRASAELVRRLRARWAQP